MCSPKIIIAILADNRETTSVTALSAQTVPAIVTTFTPEPAENEIAKGIIGPIVAQEEPIVKAKK